MPSEAPVPHPGTATVFLSTGRAGTQWVASVLRANYSDLAVVTHEPIAEAYRPRDFYRRYEDPEAVAAIPEVAAHLDRVCQILQSRDYIETGWPVYAAIPLVVGRFPGRARVVHLLRHPVRTAL